MIKQHYVIKLIPRRATFAQDMSEDERNIMLAHITYWKSFLDQGIMLVFGPVMDPNGVFGLGILEVDNEDQVIELTGNDPASEINDYEYYPMRAVVSNKLKG